MAGSTIKPCRQIFRRRHEKSKAFNRLLLQIFSNPAASPCAYNCGILLYRPCSPAADDFPCPPPGTASGRMAHYDGALFSDAFYFDTTEILPSENTPRPDPSSCSYVFHHQSLPSRIHP